MLAATVLLFGGRLEAARALGREHAVRADEAERAASAADGSELAAGKTVFRQTLADTGKGGRALAVQDVAAAPSTVWDRSSRSRTTCRWCRTRSRPRPTRTRPGLLCTMKVRMKIGAMGVGLEFFISHTYDPKLSVMTWTLDYGRKSDVIDSVGYWGVEPHPSKPGQARVFYSVDVAMPDWLPGFVVGILNSKALSDATGWVKTESEKKQKALGPVGGAAAPTNKKQCKQQEGSWSKGKCELPPAPAAPPAAPSTTTRSPRRSPSGCSAPPPRWRDEALRGECGRPPSL